jgi:hypothetical protein
MQFAGTRETRLVPDWPSSIGEDAVLLVDTPIHGQHHCSGNMISNAFGALIASGILANMDGVRGHAAWR